MADFEKLRADLRSADDAARSAERRARAAGLSSATRERDLAAARGASAEAAARRASVIGAFAEGADPRRAAAGLPDTSPVLLLPVRLETRFRSTEAGAVVSHQLLVRIYPDACSVDAFDEELSTAEIGSAMRFWREYWRAGGVDAERRAAWASLAGTTGGGRAGWIVQQYFPLNQLDEPVKVPATDLVLVIAGSSLPASGDRAAIADYWTRVWRADGDPAELTAAASALVTAIGSAVATDAVENAIPFNLADDPPTDRTRASALVRVSWLKLPPDPGEERLGWRRAPVAAAMPEQFVVLAYVDAEGPPTTVVARPVRDPLYVGPDPAAPPGERIEPHDGVLDIPDQLAWLFDFDAAVAAGMAVAIPISPDQAARGFDRVLAIGLRLRDDETQGAATFAGLLRGHGYSKAGFDILRQGSATNNDDQAAADYRRRLDPAIGYDDAFGAARYAVDPDPLAKRDGQVLAERLGLPPDAFLHTHGADGRDIAEAHALNSALSPGTIGYLAGVALTPEFEHSLDELVRFSGRQLSGRGMLPAIRIGSQPYGIVASTAHSRIEWLHADGRGLLLQPSGHIAFLAALHEVLNRVQKLLGDPERHAHVGAPGDPHQLLLDILGLHPTSAEYHVRYAKSVDELSSRAFLTRIGGRAYPSSKTVGLQQRQSAIDLLRSLGYSGTEIPDLLDLYFKTAQLELKGPLIDDLPLSESEILPAVTTDGFNYVRWLADAAGGSLERLRQESGFVAGTPPRALLYQMLHFALTRGFLDAHGRLADESGLFSVDDIRALRHEPKSVHLDPAATTSESPWARLYASDARITGDATRTLAEFIVDGLAARPAWAIDLADQVRAVRVLEDAPTARLERVLAEHIDLMSCRFDAWRLGITGWQLDRMRGLALDVDPPGQGAPVAARQGLYLGAYGIVEDLRPKPAPLPGPELPEPLATAFKDGPPLVIDPTNGGHLHAPSLNQAVTAAILRAGSLENRVPGSPDAFSINLSSERVRRGLDLLEGIRSGQSVGALLGYSFERALHDAGAFAQLDVLVFAFRRAFPLIAGKLTPTLDPPAAADEAIEARNVIDGLALVQVASAPATKDYPYGKSLPGLSSTQLTIVKAAVAGIVDTFDALADLTLAESVHETSQGNTARAAAHLDVAGTFQAPPEPDVVRTPDRGFSLTCRMGLELDATATAPPGSGPRATAQPAINAWLTSALPPLTDIECTVVWTVPGSLEQSRTVTMASLGLAPYDLVELLTDVGGEGSREIEDRIRRSIMLAVAPRPDAAWEVRYRQAGAGRTSVFAASALTRRLATLVHQARPLRAGDVTLPSAAQKADAVDHVVDRARIGGVATGLGGLLTRLDTAISAGQTLLADPVANRAAMIAGIDDRIALAVERLAEAADFGGARVGWGAVYDWRGERFRTLLARVAGLLGSWNDRALRCSDLLAQEAALPLGATDAERTALLRTAESLVSTAIDPALTPVALRGVVQTELAALTARAATIVTTVISPADARLSDRLTRCAGILPLDDVERTPPAFGDVEDSIVAYWTDLQHLLLAARDDLRGRSDAAAAALLAHDGAADAAGRLTALQNGAEALFGEGFRLVPTFRLPAAAAAEQTAAHAAFTSGGLLAYAATTLDDDFPLDTWFYGAARVRPMLRLLEDAVMLWDAQSLAPGELTALQLPHRPAAPWLALDFPKAFAPTSESLSYVAFAAPGYDPAATRCGLLLDDWSEVIPALGADEPGPQHETAVAINFDRPSQEPPQVMMLLTPPRWTGSWDWDDIVQGVIDTVELAKLRALEPADLDPTPFSWFLPATLASVTTTGLSPSANYALTSVVPTFLREI